MGRFAMPSHGEVPEQSAERAVTVSVPGLIAAGAIPAAVLPEAPAAEVREDTAVAAQEDLAAVRALRPEDTAAVAAAVAVQPVGDDQS